MTKGIDIATKMIKLNEGLRLEVYTCDAGFKTFGFGTNLEVVSLATVKKIAKLSADLGDVDFGYRCEQTSLELAIGYVSDEIKGKLANYLLNQELLNCATGLNSQKWFTDDLSKFQQAIIIDLAYNMGVVGVLKFNNMIKAIKQRNYGIAGTEMLDSKYHYQMICYGYKDELAEAEIDARNRAEVVAWYNNLQQDSKQLRSLSNALSLQFDKPLGQYKELL